MVAGELLEICEVECRMVTMCWPSLSHSVNDCTVVVKRVLAVAAGGGGGAAASDSSLGESGVTWSAQGMYRQQRMSKRLASRR